MIYLNHKNDSVIHILDQNKWKSGVKLHVAKLSSEVYSKPCQAC